MVVIDPHLALFFPFPLFDPKNEISEDQLFLLNNMSLAIFHLHESVWEYSAAN